MISLLLWATLFLSMTYNKYAKYNFTIHQIDTHGTVLKGLMSFLISNFVWLVMNSSVSSGLFPSIYFSSVIEVFFRCYFRIIRHSMMRSQDELNNGYQTNTYSVMRYGRVSNLWPVGRIRAAKQNHLAHSPTYCSNCMVRLVGLCCIL